MTQETKGIWENAQHCISCKEFLTSKQEMHSRGICPYCGNNSNSTIIDTVTKVRRWVKYKGLYNYIFQKGQWEYKNE